MESGEEGPPPTPQLPVPKLMPYWLQTELPPQSSHFMSQLRGFLLIQMQPTVLSTTQKLMIKRILHWQCFSLGSFKMNTIAVLERRGLGTTSNEEGEHLRTSWSAVGPEAWKTR